MSQDAIDKHRDPMYIKKHLENSEGAGRNLLSVFCCNYYFVKLFAEPFLNTSRGVQDLVDNTTECVQVSRSRLSCGDFMASSGALSSAGGSGTGLDSRDAESGLGGAHNDDHGSSSSKYDDKEKRICGVRRSNTALAWLVAALCSPNSYCSLSRMVHGLAIVISACIVLLFIYASFTV